MRVAGVATTLSPEGMIREAPDMVFPDIGDIKLADILGSTGMRRRGPRGGQPSEAPPGASATPPTTSASTLTVLVLSHTSFRLHA